MNKFYNQDYFNSKIFDYDYNPIAKAIYEEYKPATAIEFGCGNGELSKALAGFGVKMIAIDGYAAPDFTGYNNIEFFKVDLNSPAEINNFLKKLDQNLDISISLEVAEHLNPLVSETLIKAMTSCAETVIFSAAIPGQAGDGHINCQTRSFWNDFFEKRNFYLIDSIRKKIRDNKSVGKWYQLNICDYCKMENGPAKEQYQLIVKNLIASESAASSLFYLSNRRYELLQEWLKLDIIALAFSFRNNLKKLIGKNPLKEIQE